MTSFLFAVVIWLALTAMVGLFALVLGRSAAMGEGRAQPESRDVLDERSGQTLTSQPESYAHEDRRVENGDRRKRSRPWVAAAPGRRAEDVLRKDIADARRALADAEARLSHAQSQVPHSA